MYFPFNKKKMTQFQDFAKEQHLEQQYPNWSNHQKNQVIQARWKEENLLKPTRYIKFVKKEVTKLKDANMTPLEKLKFVAQKWRNTKYYKHLLLEKSQVEVEFPNISHNDAFAVAAYRLDQEK